LHTRLSLAITIGAVAVLATAGPAFAAGATQTWTAGGGGNQEWSTAANWGGTAIGADDLLTFSAGTHAHNDLGPSPFGVAGMTFSAAGFLVDGDKILLGAGGITATQSATTNLDVDIAVDQTWSAAGGSTLVNQGTVNVLSGTLTIDGSGTTEFATRLDGNGGAGSVVKTGTGTLILSGGGGAIGGGLQANQGTTRVTGMLAGTDFRVNGGTLTGGNAGDPLLGVVRALTLDAGTIAPGTAPGDVSTIHTWEPFTANAGGTLEFDVDGTASDSLDIYKDAVLNGATLHLNVATAPPVGTVLTLVSSQIGTVTGQLLSRTGATLTSGEFVDSGQRWSIGIGQGSVSVEYLGAVPVPAADPALADTGATSGWLFPVGGGLLALGLVIFVLRRGLARRSNR
jgi:hypothetical protein